MSKALAPNLDRRMRHPAARSQAASGRRAFSRDVPRYARTVEDGRAASTAIYFLLARGERSHWHRVDAVEVWHWYAGAPLELEIAAERRTRSNASRSGNDLASGERPQAVVPAHAWQAAESLGDWTLGGCTVAPGFEFKGFELAPKGWTP